MYYPFKEKETKELININKTKEEREAKGVSLILTPKKRTDKNLFELFLFQKKRHAIPLSILISFVLIVKEKFSSGGRG